MSPYGRVLCSEACTMQVITVLCAFTFLHSYHYQVWMHCWKTSLFLPVTEMLSQKIRERKIMMNILPGAFWSPERLKGLRNTVILHKSCFLMNRFKNCIQISQKYGETVFIRLPLVSQKPLCAVIYSLLLTALSQKLEIISHQKVFADLENIWFWSDVTSGSFRGVLDLFFVPLVQNCKLYPFLYPPSPLVLVIYKNMDIIFHTYKQLFL